MKALSDWRTILADVLGDDAPETLSGIPFSEATVEEIRDEITSLVGDLESIEKRLGTAAERSDDMEQVRELAHRLRSKLTTVLAVPREQRNRFVRFAGGISTAA